MKKLSAGYYEGIYNGVKYTVTKIECKENLWYWQVGNKPAEDNYTTKKRAQLSAIEWITE